MSGLLYGLSHWATSAQIALEIENTRESIDWG